MKNIQSFEEFLNESISKGQINKTSIQAFIQELGAWPEIQNKIEDPGKLKIVAKENHEFRFLLQDWVDGKYDNDMDALADDLNVIIRSEKTEQEKNQAEEKLTNYY